MENFAILNWIIYLFYLFFSGYYKLAGLWSLVLKTQIISYRILTLYLLYIYRQTNLMTIYIFRRIVFVCLMLMLYVFCLSKVFVIEFVRLYTPSSKVSYNVIMCKQGVAELGNIPPCKMSLHRDMGPDSPTLLRNTNIRRNSWIMRISNNYRISVVLRYTLDLAGLGGRDLGTGHRSPFFFPFFLPICKWIKP